MEIFFKSASHSGQAHDLKINPAISITFSFIHKHIKSIVIYGTAELDTNKHIFIHNTKKTWDTYIVKPTYYKFITETPLKLKSFSDQKHRVKLEDYKLIENKFVITRNEHYPN